MRCFFSRQSSLSRNSRSLLGRGYGRRVEGDEVGSRFSDKVSEFRKELVHSIAPLAFIQDMSRPASFECCQTGDRVYVFAVEDVNPMDTEDVLGVGGW